MYGNIYGKHQRTKDTDTNDVLIFLTSWYTARKAKNKFQHIAMADGIDDIIGALGTGNETAGGTIDKGVV